MLFGDGSANRALGHFSRATPGHFSRAVKLYALDPLPELAAVRRHELGAALNRLRSLVLD